MDIRTHLTRFLVIFITNFFLYRFEFRDIRMMTLVNVFMKTLVDRFLVVHFNYTCGIDTFLGPVGI